MGSKTFEGLGKKTLPNRTTIILTRDLNYEANGAIICNSIEEALNSTMIICILLVGKKFINLSFLI